MSDNRNNPRQIKVKNQDRKRNPRQNPSDNHPNQGWHDTEQKNKFN